ncbi:alpha/beta fold hydrolase [Nonomuraea sp. NPDC050227]|uniref:alpha/beta fold hydrolase n=1 Tax=Nonomuraea sp. NPDC050227 TaxID=3364360 RepID=UPI0037B08374
MDRRAARPVQREHVGVGDGPGEKGVPGAAFRGRRLGHFRDPSAFARYRTAHDQAMAQLPEPAETHDVTTGFGTVRVHLLGVSIGGWSAFQLAMRAPDKIASVSLLDPAITFGRITWKVVIVSLGSVVPSFPESWRRKLLSWISGGADASGDEPIANLISAGMRDFTSFLPPPSYPADDQVAGVEAPVLALIAGRSIIHDPGKAGQRARRLLSHGVVELWPDASHASNGEFPERVNSRILTFIDELDRTAGAPRAGQG